MKSRDDLKIAQDKAIGLRPESTKQEASSLMKNPPSGESSRRAAAAALNCSITWRITPEG